MNQENRDDRYLRILTSGVQSESDYEDAKYLIDKGYGDGKYRVSKGRDSYGKVSGVVWTGYTSNGLDFIDELRARADGNNPQELTNANSDTESNAIGNDIVKWHETFYGKITIGVIVGVIVFFVKSHFI